MRGIGDRYVNSSGRLFGACVGLAPTRGKPTCNGPQLGGSLAGKLSSEVSSTSSMSACGVGSLDLNSSGLNIGSLELRHSFNMGHLAAVE